MHLGSNYEHAQLELKSDVDQDEWRAVCVAPCDLVVKVSGRLARVTAPGMTSSNTFRIEPGVGTALIRVDGGSAQARSLGLLGLGVGIPTSIVGMAIFSYGKFADVQGARVGGGIVLGAGALVLVSAIPALLIGSTKVRDGRGSTIARALRTGTLSF